MTVLPTVGAIAEALGVRPVVCCPGCGASFTAPCPCREPGAGVYAFEARPKPLTVTPGWVCSCGKHGTLQGLALLVERSVAPA